MSRRLIAITLQVLPVLAAPAFAQRASAAAPTAFPPILLPPTTPGSLKQTPSTPLPVYAPAPMPDQDLQSPDMARAVPTGPALAPSLWHPKQKDVSNNGYVPGSTMQSEQVRREKPLPGLHLIVPLD